MNRLLQFSVFFLEDSPKIAKYLIEHGANINEIDHNGNSLLHQILYNRAKYDEGQLIIIKALIDRELDVNSQNNDGDTGLHLTRLFWGNSVIIY